MLWVSATDVHMIGELQNIKPRSYFVLVLTGPMYLPFYVKLNLKLLWVYSLDMPSMWYTNKQMHIWGGKEKAFLVVQLSIIYIYAMHCKTE
jgi:hypothetical protein